MDSSDRRLDLVVLSDLLAGRGPASRLYPVDKDSLDEFLREAALESLGSFKDFRPERLAARLPAAAGLLKVRAQALDLAQGKGTLASLRETLGAHPDLGRSLEPSAPRPAGPAPAPTGDVFDLVDADRPAVDAQGLIDAVLGLPRAAEGPPPAELRELAARAERALAPLLRAALRNPALRELERSWRGLRYLVRSTDFRAGIRVHVVPTPRPGLVEALRKTVLPFADDVRSQGGRVCILLDFTVDPSSPEQTGELEKIADEAAGHATPILASAERRSGLEALEPWSRLRSRDSARWLALAVNGFLLRLPYGRGTDPVKDFDFEENPEGAPAEFLRGRPGWILAALVASSFARTGWGVDFAGRDAAADLEPLPGEPALEADLKEEEARGLLEAGLVPLVAGRNSDRAFAAGSSSVHPASDLRHAFFAAQVGASLQTLLGALDPQSSLEEIARTTAAELEKLGLTERGPVYAVTGRPAETERPSIALAVRPCGALLRGLPELRLDVPLPLH